MLKLRTCELRPWHGEDLESLQYHANNRKIWLNLRDRFPHPYTEQDASHWLSLVASESPVLNMAIDVGDQAVGGIGIELQSDFSSDVDSNWKRRPGGVSGRRSRYQAGWPGIG